MELSAEGSIGRSRGESHVMETYEGSALNPQEPSSSDSRPLIKYSQMGVIQFYSVSAATVDTSLPFIDMFAKTSTNTSFVRCSKIARFFISISSAIHSLVNNASYSASNLRAYVYSFPLGLISIRPAPEPSKLPVNV
ncbi:hypothetical protein Tco_1532051 [Tanacetum coccineum]